MTTPEATDIYLALTPFGTVQVRFDVDGEGATLDGPADALAHLRRVLRETVGPDGILMDEGTLEPFDLYFGLPPDAGIVVMPPPDALEAIMRETLAREQAEAG